ncbi:hypothetical protein [Salinisphaera aquimarina]|uniref:Lipoprotein n=1 Tax=Salinisphaera aquimarina TaxID=2094031 RepID=A0ABV7EKT4_9GAMM
MAGIRNVAVALVLTGPIALGLSACDGSADPDALFPLTPGLEWTYRIQVKPLGKELETSTRTMQNVSRDDFAGEPKVTIRRNDGGARYYVAERDDGYYRVAMKSVIHHHPIIDQPPIKILPLPVKAGATWIEPAHTYMLGRAKTFITEHAPGNTITLDYRVESENVDVDVPAGHFTGCAAVIGETSFHLGAGVGFLPSDVPIVQKEWYCPGVGLVRLERDEKVTNSARVITGGRLKMELLHGPS